MVPARCCGSWASGASGRPCATSQNGQRRVQMSPRIMKVAVPLPKHSAMFGHDASSHTVCSACARRMRFTSWKRESGLAARTRIHAGFASGARGTMRIVFAWPFCFTPASRMVEPLHQNLRQLIAHLGRAFLHAKIFQLRNGKPRIAARIDGAEGREVHVDVEREAVVGTAALDADAERGELGAADIDPGRAGATLGARTDEVDYRLLE